MAILPASVDEVDYIALLAALKALKKGDFSVRLPMNVEMVETVDPDIAFIDLGLPGIDGYEVARRLRAGRGKDVFLIALSGYGQSEDRRRAIEAGFDMHVVKPIDPDRLASVIASLQERRLGELAKETLDGGSG